MTFHVCKIYAIGLNDHLFPFCGKDLVWNGSFLAVVGGGLPSKIVDVC